MIENKTNSVHTIEAKNELKPKSKICLIIHSLGIGGMERVMVQLAANFVKRKNTDVHLVLIGRNREIKYSVPQSVKIHRPEFEFDNTRRTRDTLATVRFLRAKVKSINPDSVLSFGEYWNNLVLLSLYGLSTSIYISDRTKPGKDLGRFQNILRNKLYPTAAGYIAQTEQARKVCRQQEWNDNIKVIGNPVHQIPVTDNTERENIVLFVGRLIRTKHVDRLINIFKEVRKPGWRLVIVGGNAKKLNLLTEYQNLVDKLGANDYISLEGERTNVEEYYNKSKIFAFPSSLEGFPNVVGEALSAGLPVVAYGSTAGISDMVTNEKNGFLVPNFDKKIFQSKLETLMEEEGFREEMGRQAKSIVDKYNIDGISSKFINFIMNNNDQENI